jgi:hypothetical protein
MVTDTITEAGTAAVEEARSAFADTSTIPFYALAAAAIAASVCLYFGGKKELGIFVGLWPPTFLALSTLNKLGAANRK